MILNSFPLSKPAVNMLNLFCFFLYGLSIFLAFSESEVVIVGFTSIVVNGNANKYNFAFPFALIAKEKKSSIKFLQLPQRRKKY